MNRERVAADLASRIAQAGAQAQEHPLLLIGAILAIVTLITLAVMGKRRAIFFALIITFPFSGSVWAAADTYSSLFRYFLLGLLALTVLYLRVRPGKSWDAFAAYIMLSIVFGVFVSPGVSTIQYSILYICLALGVASLAQDMQSPSQIAKICLLFSVPASIWALLAIINFSNFSGLAGRFSGGGNTAPLFVMTGGMCLPFVVWGALRSTSMKWRIPFMVILPVIVFFLIFSAQRTGAFAGIIGCMPLLVRRKFGKMLGVGVLAGVCFGAIWLIQSLSQEQSQYIAERFFNTSTTGRWEVWEQVLSDHILSNPFIGHGPASSRGLEAIIGLGTHNAYLSIWYNASIFGLLLFFVVITIAYWRSGTLIFRAADLQTSELARLLLGVLMATTASGLFEAVLSAPSQIASVTFLLSVVAIEQLYALNTNRLVVQKRQRTLMRRPMPEPICHSSLTQAKF